MKRGWTIVGVLAILSATLVIDQGTKEWAIAELGGAVVIPVIPTVSLRLVYNPGVAFGMGAEFGPILAVGLLLVLIGLLGYLVFRIVKRKPVGATLLVAVIAGGGWGNMFDRIFRAESGPLTGHVVDFLAVDWFAIFNVADIFAVCGVIAFGALTVFAQPRATAAGVTVATTSADPG